ncbi:MAG: hypothetical protein OQL28_15365 [Sedimenticola sp.]|nr:hypothetical protein [Sedimenticola sp.]
MYQVTLACTWYPAGVVDITRDGQQVVRDEQKPVSDSFQSFAWDLGGGRGIRPLPWTIGIFIGIQAGGTEEPNALWQPESVPIQDAIRDNSIADLSGKQCMGGYCR